MRRRAGPGEPRQRRARTNLAARPPSAAPGDPGATELARWLGSAPQIRSAERHGRTAVRQAIDDERASNGSGLDKCVHAATGTTGAVDAPAAALPSRLAVLVTGRASLRGPRLVPRSPSTRRR